MNLFFLDEGGSFVGEMEIIVRRVNRHLNGQELKFDLL